MLIQDNSVFKRTEIKYLLTPEKYQKVLSKLTQYMQPDQYPYETVCSIYYDTASYDLINRSLAKPAYKEKLRIRSYGSISQNGKAYIELKKKYQKIVYKRRVEMDYQEAINFLGNNLMPSIDNQIVKEIAYFRSFYSLIPKYYLAYEREAYNLKSDLGFRITFDHNIRYRENDLSLTGSTEGKNLYSDSMILMEIKPLTKVPLEIVKILSDLKIYPTSQSKYGGAYINEHGLVNKNKQVEELYPLKINVLSKIGEPIGGN